MDEDDNTPEEFNTFLGADGADEDELDADRGDLAEEIADPAPAPDPDPDPDPDPAPAPAEKVEEIADPAADPTPDADLAADPAADPAAALDADTDPAADPVVDPPVEPKVDHRIPKERFDTVNDRMKIAEARTASLEEENRRLQGDTEGTENFDFQGKEREYMEFVVDGHFDKAGTVREEIRRAEQAQFTEQSNKVRGEAVAQTQAELSMTTASDEVAGQFDAFNDKSEGFDQVLLEEALDLRDGFMNKGMAGPDAIRKAARYMAKVHDLVDNTADAPAVEAPAPVADKKTDVPAKAAAAAAQAPEMVTASKVEETTLSAADLPEADFDALPESTLKRMRGDIV